MSVSQDRKKLAELLKTKEVAEQVKTVEHLFQVISAPVFDVIIHVDARTHSLGVSTVGGGGEVPVDVLYNVLEEARRILQEQERKVLAERGMTNNVPPAPPGLTEDDLQATEDIE